MTQTVFWKTHPFSRNFNFQVMDQFLDNSSIGMTTSYRFLFSFIKCRVISRTGIWKTHPTLLTGLDEFSLTNPLIIRHHHISLNLLVLRARNSSHIIHKYISNKSYGAWRHNKIQWKNFKGWKPWIIAGGNGSNLSAGHNWGNIAELCWFELLKILYWPETVIC